MFFLKEVSHLIFDQCRNAPCILRSRFVRNRQPLGALGIFNERDLEKDTNVQNRFFEPARLQFPHLVEVKDNVYGITSKTTDPLAFLPPGDFHYFSVSFGDFNLSFARQSGRLWAYVHSGGPSLDKILADGRPENSPAALIPITEDGHGILFLDDNNNLESPTVRVRLEGRLVKVDLGHRGIFVADMGSLRPKHPDPLIHAASRKSIDSPC